MSDLFAAFGIDGKLLLIQALNFGILLLILWKFLYTPVLKMIDDRRKKIEEGVKTAEQAEKNLAASETEGQEIRTKASREAEAMVVAARARAEEKKAEMMKEAEMKAEALLSDATARAEETQRQALKQSEKEIARAAMLAAEKLLRKSA